MNYLAHARELLDRPWAAAGSAVPDWLKVLARKARVRPEDLPEETGDLDEETRGVLVGLRRHYVDDGWFHATPAFLALTSEIAGRIRAGHPAAGGGPSRASLFAHILLEVLLDAAIMDRDPAVLHAYRRALAALDPDRLEAIVLPLVHAPGPVDGLSNLVVRFRASPVLEGYLDDATVVHRLNMVGRRVRQPDLPDGFQATVAWARGLIATNADALLSR